MAETGLGCYVYCVIAAAQLPRLPDGVAGVAPDFAVEPVVRRGLCALTSRVPLDQFGADALRRNLEELAWVERTARAHDAVLRAAAAADAVVPLRLCTIFADADHVAEMLDREHARLRDALFRLRGRGEWSVKVRADPRRVAAVAALGGGEEDEDAAAPRGGRQVAGRDEDAPASRAGRPDDEDAAAPRAGRGDVGGDEDAPASHAGRPDDEGAAAPRAGRKDAGAQPHDAPGRAFFARKQAERASQERARAVATAAAEEVHARLSADAAAARLLAPQHPALSGRAGAMLLNGAYLVDSTRAAAFAATVEELAARHRATGVEIDVSGPWAPYTFADQAPDDERRAAAGQPA